jgi:glycosyltransferase involved in cell wall biosynthesis
MLTSSYPRNDQDEAGIFVARLAEALAKLNLSVAVVVPHDKNEPTSEVSNTIQIRRFKYGLFTKGNLAFGAGMLPNIRRNPLRLLQVPLYIVQTVRTALKAQTNPSLIHANWTLPLIAAWLLHLFWKLPYVVTIRGEDFRLLQKTPFRILLAPAIRRAHTIISVNQSFLSFFTSTMKLPDSQVVCITNGVSLPELQVQEVTHFKQRYSLPSAPLLGYVGTIIPRKRIEVLIESLTQKSLSGVHLLLAGRLTDLPYLHEIRALATRYKVHDRVHFLGPLPPHEVPLLLSAIDVYVTASEFEGRPNAVLEALAAGKPSVVSKIEAHQEVIAQNQNGFLCTNAQDMAVAIASILQDKDLRERLASQAKLSVADKSWEHCAQRYLALYRQIAPQQSKSA